MINAVDDAINEEFANPGQDKGLLKYSQRIAKNNQKMRKVMITTPATSSFGFRYRNVAIIQPATI